MSNPVHLYLLGSGTVLSDGEQACSSILIQTGTTTILIDCGIGAFLHLKKSGIQPAAIDFVFITHFHPDHMADLISLLFYLANAPGPAPKTLQLWGPPGFLHIMNTFSAIYGDWLEPFLSQVNELQASSLRWEAFSLNWRPVWHSKQAIGYRFTVQEKIISFSGDSGYCPALVSLCQSADLAILECSFPDVQEKSGHLTPSLVARIANEAQVKRLILTHMYPENDPQMARAIIQKSYPGVVEIGQDFAHFILQ